MQSCAFCSPRLLVQVPASPYQGHDKVSQELNNCMYKVEGILSINWVCFKQKKGNCLLTTLRMKLISGGDPNKTLEVGKIIKIQ